jgi:uncharacterized membrane-anchored protein
MGGVAVKNLTKVSIFFLAFFIFSTVYALAAFVGNQINPLPEPFNLLILGIAMTGLGHFLKRLNNK